MSEWRIISGIGTLDGRAITPNEYMRAKRKIRLWLKMDRAYTALACESLLCSPIAVLPDMVPAVADLLQEWTASHRPMIHCSHCRWCAYIATLICWASGFVADGPQAVGDVSRQQNAASECNSYLNAMSSKDRDVQVAVLKQTTGLLIVASNKLQIDDAKEGIVASAAHSLRRLLGIDVEISSR